MYVRTAKEIVAAAKLSSNIKSTSPAIGTSSKNFRKTRTANANAPVQTANNAILIVVGGRQSLKRNRRPT